MPWLSLLSPPVGSETGGPGSSLNIEPGELETAVQTEPCGGRIITKKKKKYREKINTTNKGVAGCANRLREALHLIYYPVMINTLDAFSLKIVCYKVF